MADINIHIPGRNDSFRRHQYGENIFWTALAERPIDNKQMPDGKGGRLPFKRDGGMGSTVRIEVVTDPELVTDLEGRYDMVLQGIAAAIEFREESNRTKQAAQDVNSDFAA